MLTKGLGGALAAALMMATGPALAQGARVTLTFTPESKTPAFEVAAAEYRSIWAAEGARVIEAMERLTTLRFPQRNIKIQVFEGPSNASLLFNRAGVPVGSRDPMRLRASYSADNKKGTLVHELGHRMNLNLRTRLHVLQLNRCCESGSWNAPVGRHTSLASSSKAAGALVFWTNRGCKWPLRSSFMAIRFFMTVT